MSAQHRLSDERGAIAVLAVVVLVGMILMSAFVIEIANWQQHRRHLQMQVDAGALAAGTRFTGCFLDPVQTNNRIEAEAHRYAGNAQFPTIYASLFPSEPVPQGPYNLQVDDPTRVQFALNAGAWPPGTTDFGVGEPCSITDATGKRTPKLDVRAKDIDIPSFLAGVLPDGLDFIDIKARAQVEIRKVKALNGFLPWAVPEVRPKSVVAIFVREDNGDVAGASPIDSNGSASLNAEAVDLWEGDVSFNMSGHTGLVILVSSRAITQGDISGLSLSQMCALEGATCHTGATRESGLDFVHGYPLSSAGVGLGDVELQKLSQTCDDSSPYFQWVAECTFRLRAEIDPSGLTQPVVKNIDLYPGLQCSGSKTAMTLDQGSWESAALQIEDGSGRNPYSIGFEIDHQVPDPTPDDPNRTRTETAQGCFSKVAVPFAATDDTGNGNQIPAGYVGPIRYVAIGTPPAFQNSLEQGTTPAVHVTVGLQPPLQVAQSASEPPILLRLGSKSGSLNQALDCDAAPRGLDEEVRDGCQTKYAVNERDLSCVGWTPSNLPPATFDPSPAPDCIAAKTGDVTSMAQGLHDRFETLPPPEYVNGCSPNRWRYFRSLGTLPPDDDPRWVTLVVTDFTAFQGQGARVVPIRVFAGFYVTGYFHLQTARGCPEDDLPPPPVCPSWPNDDGSSGCNPRSNKNKGNVWGYFVTRVSFEPNANEDDEFCAFDELGVCTAVLTE